MKIERYILTSRNDSSVNSFETKCFQKHADAYICMLTEALETVRKSGNCKDGEVHVDPMSNASVLSFKYKGVTYEWSIDWQAIELDTQELNYASREAERELERELEKQNITGGEK